MSFSCDCLIRPPPDPPTNIFPGRLTEPLHILARYERQGYDMPRSRTGGPQHLPVPRRGPWAWPKGINSEIMEVEYRAELFWNVGILGDVIDLHSESLRIVA